MPSPTTVDAYFGALPPDQRVLLEAMDNPDKEAARRAFQAMMTMRKIDVAKIEAALKGETADA